MISKFQKVFNKGYLSNLTNELFTVTSAQLTITTMYKLQDYKAMRFLEAFTGTN